MAIQEFGTSFDLEKFYRAREVARDITFELSSHIRPGMVEEEAQMLYKQLCKNHPVEKQWHPTKIRFGPNTIKNFRDISEPYVLQEEDIYFIDIGPVIEGHEADYGQTFTVGSIFDHKHIADSSLKVFAEVSQYWQQKRVSGLELYQFARSRAESYGYILNMGMDGHRLGDFPHHIYFKGGLGECEEIVIPHAWILEIHLWNKKKFYGAFFEDLLTDQTLS